MPLDIADTGRLRDALAVIEVAAAVDLHNAVFQLARSGFYDVEREHRAWWSGRIGQMDLPRARRGGLKGALWSVAIHPLRSTLGRVRATKEAVSRLRAFAMSTPGVAWVTTASAFDLAIARGDHAVIPALAAASALGDAVSLRSVDLADVVCLALVHRLSSSYGETSTPWPLRRVVGPAGLSARGRALIEQLALERVLLDLVHASPDTFWDAVSVHDRSLPLVVSHAGASKVYPHWRALDDAQLKAIADTGGVVGVTFEPACLGPPSSHDDGIALVMRHLAQIIDVVGDDHAAFGSGFGGISSSSPDLHDPLALPALVVEMQARGFRPERIAKILGGNFRRVFGAMRPGVKAR
jgi:membrane dipeptidase